MGGNHSKDSVQFKTDVRRLEKLLFGGEPICMNVQHISIKIIGLHERLPFSL